jgi:hypothetical protein
MEGLAAEGRPLRKEVGARVPAWCWVGFGCV